MRTVLRVSICLLVAIASSGCAHLLKRPHLDYTTVAESPHRDTKNAVTENAKGLTLSSEEKWDEAEQAFQQALIADVTYGPAHNNLGKLYYHQRKYYLAAWEFDYAIRLMPDRHEPYNNLGLLYEDVGRLDDADHNFKEALARAPNNPECLGNLARARLRRGVLDEETAELLRDLILYDSRGPWIEWAKEELANGNIAMPFFQRTQLTQPPAEELPIPNSDGESSLLPRTASLPASDLNKPLTDDKESDDSPAQPFPKKSKDWWNWQEWDWQ